MNSPTSIDIGNDYSPTPAGRFPDDGPYNGEDFRERILVPALERGPVMIRIDTVEGLGSSFLEEAFGGLIRKHSYTEEKLRQLLTIVFDDQSFRAYERLIWTHISDALKNK